MSALWDYMSKQHGLNLLGSEIDDILALARQEIDLPDEEELYRTAPEEESVASEKQALAWISGAKYAINKVRNPYPKTM
jgi:hypothetical protein